MLIDRTLDGTRQTDMARTIDHYQFEAELGRGGGGVVYRVRDLDLNRSVALKVLGRASDQAALIRFQRELQALAGLDHPGLVRVHATGQVEGCPYYVMELVEGESLEDLLRRGPLSPQRAKEIALELAGALEYVHAAGLLHRDIKPSNVLLGADGRTRLTDFGLVKELDSSVALTRSGMSHGTPGFWSPEQARGKISELSPATDVYGVGVTLYAMLTARPPFDPGLGLRDNLVQTLSVEPPPPSQFVSGIPPALEALTLRCLAKDPGERCPDGGALRRALEEELAPPPRRSPLLWACLLGALALGALTLTAGLGLQPSSTPSRTPGVSIRASASATPKLEPTWSLPEVGSTWAYSSHRKGPDLDCLARWTFKVGEVSSQGDETRVVLIVARMNWKQSQGGMSLGHGDTQGEKTGLSGLVAPLPGQRLTLTFDRWTGQVTRLEAELELGTDHEEVDDSPLVGGLVLALRESVSSATLRQLFETSLWVRPPRSEDGVEPVRWELTSTFAVQDASLSVRRRFSPKERGQFTYEGRVVRRLNLKPLGGVKAVHTRGTLRGQVGPGLRHRAELEFPTRDGERITEVVEFSCAP